MKEGGGAGGEPFFYLTIFVFIDPWFPFSVLGFLLYCMYDIWQDAGIRTQVAATAARCATNDNELHTSLMSYTHP